MQTYLFYDIETTGLNKSFDQVLQFAAIRTDLNLKELARHEITVKLNRDVIPSPFALLTHKMSVKQCMNGINEFEAIKQIHQILNQPGTISLGYNTLGFDDEFLRFSFYRNLLKPYTHQFANQCGRMDIFPMTVMFYLYKNQALRWPELNNKVSLKLENLNAANQFVVGRAHDAMIDVEATVGLAKCLMAEKETWDFLHGYFKKDSDLTRMTPLRTETALLVSPRLGAQNAFQSPVLFLGEHRHYKPQWVWLRLDAVDFADAAPEKLHETAWAINKKPGEPNFILPYKERFLTSLSDERILLAEKNVAWLKQHPAVFENLIEHFVNYTYPVHPNTDAEASLYVNGFLSREDDFFCQRFHAASAHEKSTLVQKAVNPTLQKLALRILGRHFPELLNTELRDQFEIYLQKVNASANDEALTDFQGNQRMTPALALADIQKIRAEKELNEEDAQLLNNLEEYLKSEF